MTTRQYSTQQGHKEVKIVSSGTTSIQPNQVQNVRDMAQLRPMAGGRLKVDIKVWEAMQQALASMLIGKKGYIKLT